MDELLDPRLGGRFCENEVYCMVHAANLCIRRDPHLRPRMSHVIIIIIIKSFIPPPIMYIYGAHARLVSLEGSAHTGGRGRRHGGGLSWQQELADAAAPALAGAEQPSSSAWAGDCGKPVESRTKAELVP
jgi:hypothetical protein